MQVQNKVGGKKTLMLTATLAGIFSIPVVAASKLLKHLYVFYILGYNFLLSKVVFFPP